MSSEQRPATSPPSLPTSHLNSSRAKRSQFPADEIPHLPTIPSFQLSSPMPSVQTKPISVRQDGRPRASLEPRPSGLQSPAFPGRVVQTNPIPGGWGRAPGTGARDNHAKRSQFGRVSGGDAQPIRCRSGQALPRADGAKQTQFPVAEIPHHSTIPTFQSYAYRAKQSQFLPERHEEQVVCGKRVMAHWTRKRPRPNKANSRTDGSGQGPARLPVPPVGALRETKPICPRSDRPRHGWQRRRLPVLGMSVRNEANLPFDSSGRGRREVGGGVVAVTACTNEPNFRWPGYPTMPLFHHSSVPVLCLSCETKPIGPGAAGHNFTVQNPMVRSTPVAAGSCGTKPMPPGREEGQLCSVEGQMLASLSTTRGSSSPQNVVARRWATGTRA